MRNTPGHVLDTLAADRLWHVYFNEATLQEEDDQPGWQVTLYSSWLQVTRETGTYTQTVELSSWEPEDVAGVKAAMEAAAMAFNNYYQERTKG